MESPSCTLVTVAAMGLPTLANGGGENGSTLVGGAVSRAGSPVQAARASNRTIADREGRRSIGEDGTFDKQLATRYSDLVCS
jgi:hypothetical protein